MSLGRMAKRFRRGFGAIKQRPAILMYHRVVCSSLDPWNLAVTPECFEQQMAWLARHRRPMSMEELVHRLRVASLPPDAVAVTFDDGYRDNLVFAKPILERYRVPGTVFLATGYVGRLEPFWWDELGAGILSAPHPLDYLKTFGDLAVNLKWGQRENADEDRSWKGWDPPQTDRQSCFQKIWGDLQSAAEEKRMEVMKALRSVLHASFDTLSLPMSRADIQSLIAGGLVTIAAHTVTHPALSDLDQPLRLREIGESRDDCQALTGAAIDGFAYPYGNFDAEVCKDVARSQLRWACTTESAFLDEGELDFYALPRITAPQGAKRELRDLLVTEG